MSCRFSVRADQRKTRAVQDGFSVTVRRKADPALTRDACIIEVRDRSGRLVLMREGFNTKLHDDERTRRRQRRIAGPDHRIRRARHQLVLLGGHRSVVEAGAACRRHVFEPLRFEADPNRRTLVWAMLSFDDLAADVGPAPTIVIAGQYREGRFVDLTSERCPVILAGTSRGLDEPVPGSLAARRLTAGRRRERRQVRRRSEWRPRAARRRVVALQMFYCGREADARELIRQVWPERSAGSRSALRFAAAAAAARRR